MTASSAGVGVCYAVTSGEYSDFSVDACFTTLDAAELHADHRRATEGQYAHIGVVALPLYPPGRTPVPRPVYDVEASLDKPLTVRVERGWEYDYHQPVDHSDGPQMWRTDNARGRCYASGTDRERCVKMVSDKIAAVKADEAGLA